MVVQGLDGTGTLVVTEFAEDTEVTVVLGVTTGGENVVRRIVENHQFRDVDIGTVAGRDIVAEGGIHIRPCRLGVRIGLEEVAVADDTLLGDVKEFLAGSGGQCEH